VNYSGSFELAHAFDDTDDEDDVADDDDGNNDGVMVTFYSVIFVYLLQR